MNITLPREAQVKAGAYDSIDEAISRIVAMLRELMELESARRSTTKLADQSN
jgi:hypothetical protein